MKTLKKTYYVWALHSILLALLLSGCGKSNPDLQAQTRIEKPKTDIQTAILSGDKETVRLHIEAGTDINEPEPFNGSTPLITAATFGKTEIAQLLIDAGADLSVKNKDGSTALHTAAFFCRVEIVQMLLDAEADKSLRNNMGATARETVAGSYSDLEPIYRMMKEQLAPLGFELDLAEVEKTRPVIAMMLQ